MSTLMSSRVGHAVAVLPYGPSLLSRARSALEFGETAARTMTILLVADVESGLGVLDSVCRRLAALVRQHNSDMCSVRLVVRQGPADQALNDLAVRESLDLVLAPEGVRAVSDSGCPTLPLGVA